ncbi:DUF5009 domain-containing protein [Puteibacter caeruleilacunae]|nr:DUF5009 domain-containing protein [Puteibacter caeruleilacunae]
MTNNKPARLLSLDALRGFDMFWIMGGEILFRALAKATDWKWADWWSNQMHHVKWDGFHAYDLVFPLFMFMSGVAIPYALLGKLEKGAPKSTIYRKVIKRAIILFVFGLIYNGFFKFEFGTLRMASVLGQIGFAYLVASIIVINTKNFKSRLIWLVGILAGYAALQLWVPVPGHGAGVLTPEGCINGYIDRMLLPGRLHGGIFDPEGILCIVSASAITLMGSLAGQVLRTNRFKEMSKVGILGATGVAVLVTGSILSIWYPLIKAAWTTSFNLVAGGLSLILLTIFYLIVDVWKYQKWTFFFRVIGLNSITIYMAMRLVNFKHTSDFVLNGLAGMTGEFQSFVLFAGLIMIEWLFLYFLYKRNIFLKV